MARHRPPFRSQMQLLPCEIADANYDWVNSGLKKEIPGNSPRLPEEQLPPRDAAPPEAKQVPLCLGS